MSQTAEARLPAELPRHVPAKLGAFVVAARFGPVTGGRVGFALGDGTVAGWRRSGQPGGNGVRCRRMTVRYWTLQRTRPANGFISGGGRWES